MYTLIFYVPSENLEDVTQAVFSSGAGKIGLYQDCYWYTKGIGSFKPCMGAEPTVGVVGQAEQVEECRVEMQIPEKLLDSVIAALKLAHPYEHPVYWVIQPVTSS